MVAFDFSEFNLSLIVYLLCAILHIQILFFRLSSVHREATKMDFLRKLPVNAPTGGFRFLWDTERVQKLALTLNSLPFFPSIYGLRLWEAELARRLVQLFEV